MVWGRLDRHKEPQKVLVEGASPLLPPQAPRILYPPAEHVQVQQGPQDLKIKAPHVLQQWVFQAGEYVIM